MCGLWTCIKLLTRPSLIYLAPLPSEIDQAGFMYGCSLGVATLHFCSVVDHSGAANGRGVRRPAAQALSEMTLTFDPYSTQHHVYYSSLHVRYLAASLMITTRKPCNRKDDRAMRPIYGCPEKFQESLATLRATFPEIANGLLLGSIVRKCAQNLKFVALPVPEIIAKYNRGYFKTLGLGSLWMCCADAPFSQKFLMGFCSDGPYECTV